MSIHKATFINKESKSGYQENQQIEIVLEAVNGKIRVTSPGAWPGPEPIMYDSDADFYKDWHIDTSSSFRGWEIISKGIGNE